MNAPLFISLTIFPPVEIWIGLEGMKLRVREYAISGCENTARYLKDQILSLGNLSLTDQEFQWRRLWLPDRSFFTAKELGWHRSSFSDFRPELCYRKLFMDSLSIRHVFEAYKHKLPNLCETLRRIWPTKYYTQALGYSIEKVVI